MKNCCNITAKNKKCFRKSDKKIFNLPRKFSKKRCLTRKIKGFTMRSSCAPFKDCKKQNGGNKQKNLFNKTLKLCSNKPLTGYMRDGYCNYNESDVGNHLVCAKMNKTFLDFTKKQNNNLYTVVKPGDKWCLCTNRYLEAVKNNKAPLLIKEATNLKAKKVLKQRGGKKTKKRFLYNPDDPIHVKYTTVKDVKNSILKLEKLFKQKKYTHKRIWQVAMIMKVRLDVIKKYKKSRYPNAKKINERVSLITKYYNHLKKRTKLKTFSERSKLIFKTF
jgi:hypothetical protein